MQLPEWLPPAQFVTVPGRGEVFVRVHRHPDAAAPTVLLLHGWTASADTQFFACYRALAEQFSIVAVDHHGHGRGHRAPEAFDLDAVADDAAHVVRTLGVEPVVSVGYSMGGPVSLHLWKRHPQLLRGMVLEATALEWRQRWRDRVRWWLLPLVSPAVRAWWFPRMVDRATRRLRRGDAELTALTPWLIGEILRNEPRVVAAAGRALRDYDARPWAATVTVPTAVLLTTRDQLVSPGKQRELAAAVGAEVLELHGDHFCSLVRRDDFAALTVAAVDSVLRRSG